MRKEISEAKEASLVEDPKQRQEQDLHSYLNQCIQTYQQKLDTLQCNLESQTLEHTKLVTSLSTQRTTYQKMALLLSEFIEHLSSRSHQLLSAQDLYLNIDDIKHCSDIHEID